MHLTMICLTIKNSIGGDQECSKEKTLGCELQMLQHNTFFVLNTVHMAVAKSDLTEKD